MAKKSARRRQSTKHAEIPLLAVTVGVIFFMLQILFLLFAVDMASGLTGLFTALWLAGGVSFAIGIVAMLRNSRWGTLLVAGPAVTFSLFCILALLSSFGTSVTELLAGV